jgi:hypothetical protein
MDRASLEQMLNCGFSLEERQAGVADYAATIAALPRSSSITSTRLQRALA